MPEAYVCGLQCSTVSKRGSLLGLSRACGGWGFKVSQLRSWSGSQGRCRKHSDGRTLGRCMVRDHTAACGLSWPLCPPGWGSGCAFRSQETTSGPSRAGTQLSLGSTCHRPLSSVAREAGSYLMYHQPSKFFRITSTVTPFSKPISSLLWLV